MGRGAAELPDQLFGKSHYTFRSFHFITACNDEAVILPRVTISGLTGHPFGRTTGGAQGPQENGRASSQQLGS